MNLTKKSKKIRKNKSNHKSNHKSKQKEFIQKLEKSDKLVKSDRKSVRVKPNKCQTVVPYEHYCVLYKSSFSSLIAALYAFYRGYYMIGLMPFILFITSINYWRYPTYSWRRNVDIGWVVFIATYQALLSITAENGWLYYIFLSGVISSYMTSHYLCNRGYAWCSTISHICTHMCGLFGQVLLYAGNIPYQFIVF